MKQCPKCGKTYDDSWKICFKDQATLESVIGEKGGFCPNCGKGINVEHNAKYCPLCGNAIQVGPAYSSKGKILPGYSNESPYYQRRFNEFDDNNGAFKPTWNWAAFFFGFFWYLFKGLYAKAFIVLGIGFVFAFIPFPLFLIY